MSQQIFYFEKPIGTILFILYLPITAGLAYSTTLDDGKFTAYTSVMAFGTLLCVLATTFIYRKWVLPAYRGTPALVLDEHTLYLAADELHISWNEIESILCKSGEYSNVIGIKIKDVDSFLHSRGQTYKTWMYRAKFNFYKHHAGIAMITIKASAEEVHETLTSFFSRYGQGATPPSPDPAR